MKQCVTLVFVVLLLKLFVPSLGQDSSLDFQSFESELSRNHHESVLGNNRRKREVEEENLIIAVEQGPLRGYRIQSETGDSFIAFSGIPYAKPPVGPLRFKDAERPEAWNGTRDAFEECSICPQPAGNPISLDGNEDCLCINVYTTELPPLEKRLMPVMVYIHGGGFIAGSGNYASFGPDYLVSEKVIVVTFNYRLNAFGFLYLREAAPGNVGLKDQVAAMRWIKRNIHAFGGDPHKITIFGQSAGAAAVHYHMLSPMTKGLFQAAIAQSGLAIDRWADQTAPLETSRRLAAAVGCTVGNDNDTLVCLQDISPETLVIAAITAAITDTDRNRLLPFTFVPTVDLKVPGVETYLTDEPVNLLREGFFHPVPFMTGFNNNESIIILGVNNFLDENIAQQIDGSWNISIATELGLPQNCSTNEEALQLLRDFFMDGKPLTNATVPQFMKMLTDIFFGKGVYYNMYLMGKYHKYLYEYSFVIDDALNALKVSAGLGDVLKGAAHGDEVGYIFRISGLSDVSPNSTAWKERQRMVRLWTNFAKYRNPTPVRDPLLQTQWKKYNNHEKYFLEIGSNLKLGKKLNFKQAKFWEKFYKSYGCRM